ncbi:MAG: hypothetical protein ACSLFD_06235 [Solirubrobacterales bacterium]
MNHHSGLLNVRRIAAMTFALLMAFAFTASLAANSADAKKKKKAKVTLAVKTKNQAALLNANKLTVKVRSSAKSKVKLSVLSGGKSNRFKKKTVKFKKKGAKTVKLALTKNGRTALKKCGAKTVKVIGSYKKGKKNAKAKKSKKLAKQASRCVDPPTPVTPKEPVCNPLDKKVCMQPWPSNLYTRADTSTATGLRLDIPEAATPKNRLNETVDTTDFNRADGFSPGNSIITKIPGVDTPAAFDNSGIPGLDDIGSSTDADSPVLLLDAATGERQPFWAELDSTPTTKSTVTFTPGQPPVEIPGGSPNDDPTNTGDVNLIIRPAKNLKPGDRYVVVIRNLKNASNAAVPAQAEFQACKGDLTEITDPELLYTCNQLNDNVFNVLAQRNIAKDASLYLAWDFTVASDESTTGRMLTIRDDAFERLGDNNLADRKIAGSAPDFDITAVCDAGNLASPQCGNGDGQASTPDTNWFQRNIEGVLHVPCYLDANGCAPGAKFAFNPDNTLTWNDSYTMDVPFRCLVPNSTVSSGAVIPGGTGVYGHGLLGNLNQVASAGSTREVGNATNSTWCAVDWAGFSESDFGTIAESLKNISAFNKATDRMQQGFLNFMMLSRALVHENGFADDPAFVMNFNGTTPITPGPAIDTSAGADTRGYYQGISQGGIMGGGLVPVSPDIDHGVLGVPGMNYSILLPRSVDFDDYAHGVIGGIYLPNVGLYDNYTNQAELPLIFSMMQLLWDRGEANGYAHTLDPAVGPLPNTNPHTVLLRVALGDHQVANVTAEVEARTIDAKLYTPALRPGRSWTGGQFGIDTFTPPLANGSNAIVYYDGGPVGYTCPTPNNPQECRGAGSKTPPDENVPPRSVWGYGADPHSYPRRSVDGINQGASFLEGNGVPACTNPLGCFSNSWNGVAGL